MPDAVLIVVAVPWSLAGVPGRESQRRSVDQPWRSRRMLPTNLWGLWKLLRAKFSQPLAYQAVLREQAHE